MRESGRPRAPGVGNPGGLFILFAINPSCGQRVCAGRSQRCGACVSSGGTASPEIRCVFHWTDAGIGQTKAPGGRESRRPFHFICEQSILWAAGVCRELPALWSLRFFRRDSVSRNPLRFPLDGCGNRADQGPRGAGIPEAFSFYLRSILPGGSGCMSGTPSAVEPAFLPAGQRLPKSAAFPIGRMREWGRPWPPGVGIPEAFSFYLRSILPVGSGGVSEAPSAAEPAFLSAGQRLP